MLLSSRQQQREASLKDALYCRVLRSEQVQNGVNRKALLVRTVRSSSYPNLPGLVRR